jgi:hypothetical protein
MLIFRIRSNRTKRWKKNQFFFCNYYCRHTIQRTNKITGAVTDTIGQLVDVIVQPAEFVF